MSVVDIRPKLQKCNQLPPSKVDQTPQFGPGDSPGGHGIRDVAAQQGTFDRLVFLASVAAAANHRAHPIETQVIFVF
jgi:hypothetical protein